jgi:hypothetical protein
MVAFGPLLGAGAGPPGVGVGTGGVAPAPVAGFEAPEADPVDGFRAGDPVPTPPAAVDDPAPDAGAVPDPGPGPDDEPAADGLPPGPAPPASGVGSVAGSAAPGWASGDPGVAGPAVSRPVARAMAALTSASLRRLPQPGRTTTRPRAATAASERRTVRRR